LGLLRTHRGGSSLILRDPQRRSGGRRLWSNHALAALRRGRGGTVTL
jgi:hypothetical protein